MKPGNALASINASTTDGALVTGVSGRRVVVTSIDVDSGGTATPITFNDKPSGAGTAISPTYSTPLALPHNPYGYFSTNAGDGLTCTTGSGATCNVRINYLLI